MKKDDLNASQQALQPWFYPCRAHHKKGVRKITRFQQFSQRRVAAKEMLLSDEFIKTLRAEELGELFHCLMPILGAFGIHLRIILSIRSAMKQYSPLMIGILMIASILFMMFGLNNPLFN